jgi:energy-coupling factor transporter ATP-binding protein EcfA2
MPQQTVPLSVLSEILAWSQCCPAWQQDALRRIVTIGALTKSDVDELEQICRAKGLGASPLDKVHIPAGPAAQNTVALLSLGTLVGVNRIPSSQKIVFGPAPGLSVIYGDNGVGKSGYARVLKRACRARDSQTPIHPDAYGTGVTAAPTAEFEYSVGGTNSPSVTWSDKTYDANLGNVFFFDSRCASNYLATDGAASFTPYGLDILPKLSQVCDEIKRRISADKTALDNTILSASSTWKTSPTESGKFLAGISEKTTADEMDKHAQFSETDTKRLTELAALLKVDGKQKALQTRASAKRLVVLSTKLKGLSTALSREAMQQLKDRSELTQNAAKAAKEFRSKAVTPTDLGGTGSALWKALWNAAQKFSELEAYTGQPFPVLSEDARCVLCQQPISPSVEILNRFNELASNELQQAHDSAAAVFKESVDAFERIESCLQDFIKVEADLVIATPEQIGGIKNWIETCDRIREATAKSLKTGTWGSVVDLQEFPGATLAGLADSLNLRAREEDSSDDSEVRKRLQLEHDELEIRQWINKHRAVITDQIARYTRLSILKGALNDTNSTTAITSKNSKLTKAVVETPFCERFKAEVEALGLRTVSVKLENIGGKKGETKFGLRFEKSTQLPVQEVASEGEQRCIALAAFLAELSQASHQSALVFDDPVCSLDHDHRWHVAVRLARESLTRQVIVFTHDTVFLNDLLGEAEKANVPTKALHITWSGTEPGYVHDDLPWDHEAPSKRLNVLAGEAQALAKTWGPKPTPAEIGQVRHLYSKLRAILERTLEKIVFNDVVFRDRSYIKTGNLKLVIGFTEAECMEYLRLLQNCHDVTDAHDTSSGKQQRVSDPSNLANDIAATKAVIDQTKARQAAI